MNRLHASENFRIEAIDQPRGTLPSDTIFRTLEPHVNHVEADKSSVALRGAENRGSSAALTRRIERRLPGEQKAQGNRNDAVPEARSQPGEKSVHFLGAALAVLSAATFALTNAFGRRGVVSGTPVQGMVISMPVGLASFLVIALLTGAVQSFGRFTPHALASLSAAGVLHFVLGRYCNFRASQAAGVNLTAPVVQLNSVVTLILAVVVLREPCTLLQAGGAILMVAGSLVTQGTPESAAARKTAAPAFRPRTAIGFFFAFLAALAYGTSPIVVRQALQDGGLLAGLAGGSIAYGAATVAVALGLLIPRLRHNVMTVSKENARWFVYSGIFVAAAHGFLYSALAVAPIMLVAPLLQLALVFRFLFAVLLNPHHEIFGFLVIAGTVVSILGACAIAIDTAVILQALAIPEPYASFLRSQLN